MRYHWIARGAKAVALLIVGGLIFGCVVMALWNALIPELFHGPTLSYWQAVGLLVLSHLFFSRGASGGWGHSAKRDHWRARFEEKLAGMTPEEQEKFKAEWKKRCGYSPDSADLAK